MMSLAQAFEELRGNLELTGLQQSTAAARQQAIRVALASDLAVLGSFLTRTSVQRS